MVAVGLVMRLLASLVTEFTGVAGLGELYGLSRTKLACPGIRTWFDRLERRSSLNVASTTVEENVAPADERSNRSAMNAAAEAMRDAASTASAHAANVRAAVSDAGPWALRSVSRALYSTSYMLSYSIVYAAVFVVQSLPQENAIMHGLHDGGAAARDALRRGE